MWFVDVPSSAHLDKFSGLQSDHRVMVSHDGLSCIPLKFSCWTLTPMTSNVTVFGAFEEITKLKRDRPEALTRSNGCPCRKRRPGHRHSLGATEGGPDGVHTPGKEAAGGRSPAHTVMSDLQPLSWEDISAVEAAGVT